ncbi:MAG: Transcriptional regulator PadR-like family protein [Euryarchaeota archaeon ADurb.Bin165]|jgi:DNA-binding PadR family transcriptional regulator|uniref:helix-turn-helix transcriptional regulator n=2 Tax=Methanospirillum sp. TaxID=45200 RepID=UPI0009D3D902|nr:helix-turn-helix transcriptional regulator [Methanospirillum sp.]OQB39147.1 MAG: Transcriptional regulator PadR-like family protein [Euryarchaeota archaeon ADurb.Bin165]
MVLDEQVVNQYSNMRPQEIRLPAMALKDDKHWAVYLYLLETGEKRFGEIGNEFHYNSNNDLYPVLKDLVEGGLVRRYVKEEDEETDRRATWYNVTDLGRNYLELLERLILPEPVPEIMRGKIVIKKTGPYIESTTNPGEYQRKNIGAIYAR